MTTPLLAKLTSEAFEESVGPLLPPSVANRPAEERTVRQVAAAFRTGTVTDQNISDFVAAELAQLRRGEPLPHDLALAATAVAVESSPSPFAADFITELARLEILELQQSVLVAKECLKHHRPVTRNENRFFQVAPPPPPSEPVVGTVVDQGERRRPRQTFFARQVPADAHAAT